MIKLVNIGVQYNQGIQTIAVLENISLEFQKGKWYSITGRSGSGKSTLLNIMSGILLPTEGEVFIENRNAETMTAEEKSHFLRTKIGYVFQDFKLIPHLNVIDNVKLPLLYEQKNQLLQKRAKELLLQVGIPETAHQKLPEQLSGGEKQRVAIARALIANPEILLCDEPTGNLDEKNRDNIASILQAIRDEGKLVIVVTHDAEIAQLGDEQYELKSGVLRKVANENV